MSLDEIYAGLDQLANCGDDTFANAAKYVKETSIAAQAGQMTASELTETMQDIQKQMMIIEDINHLQYKEHLNTLINGIITVASFAL